MKNKPGRVKAVDRNHPAFNKNAEAFYRIIMEGLKGERRIWTGLGDIQMFFTPPIICGCIGQQIRISPFWNTRFMAEFRAPERLTTTAFVPSSPSKTPR